MIVVALNTSFALVLAIALSMAIGIAAGYYSIVGILSLLTARRPAEVGVSTARLVVNTGTQA
jgi:hypothetical protein